MNLKIVSFPFLVGDVHRSPFYGVYIYFATVRSNNRNIYLPAK